MTARQLIALIQENPDAEICLWDCYWDCIGSVEAVTVEPDGRLLLEYGKPPRAETPVRRETQNAAETIALHSNPGS